METDIDISRVTTFFVRGNPRGKARPRFAHGHAYTDDRTRDYERLVQQTFLAAGGKRLHGPVSVSIKVHFGVPDRWNKAARELAFRGKLAATRKPDIDNIAKIILDALNGVAWEDDVQVVNLSIGKAYSDEPSVSVTVFDASDYYEGGVVHGRA